MFRDSTLVVLMMLGLGTVQVGTATGAIATFDLGAPVVTPQQARIPVSLGFSGDPSDTIEAIQLSVLGSDSLLTASGTNFSRFSFYLNTTTLPNWHELVSVGSFGVGLYAPQDPISGPFLNPSASPYALGTLTIDLANLPTDRQVLVTLADGPPGLDTDVGGTVNGALVPSFAASGQVAQVAFTEPSGVSFFTTSVPEPGSLTLLGLGVLGLVSYACRRQRSACV